MFIRTKKLSVCGSKLIITLSQNKETTDSMEIPEGDSNLPKACQECVRIGTPPVDERQKSFWVPFVTKPGQLHRLKDAYFTKFSLEAGADVCNPIRPLKTDWRTSSQVGRIVPVKICVLFEETQKTRE